VLEGSASLLIKNSSKQMLAHLFFQVQIAQSTSNGEAVLCCVALCCVVLCCVVCMTSIEIISENLAQVLCPI